MTDSDPGVRIRAAEIAAALGGAMEQLATGGDTPESPSSTVALEQSLLGLLEDPDERVCEVAAFALGEVPLSPDAAPGNDAGIPTRVRALASVATGHDDSLCREAAVAALGALGHPAGLPAVLGACGDRAQIRRRAVLALAAFEDPRASAMLGELTSDRDLQVSQAATDLLGIETGEDI